MKHYYLVASREWENGKRFAFMVKVGDNENLLAVIERISPVKSLNICPSKKEAVEMVIFWNECYRENGTHYYYSESDYE